MAEDDRSVRKAKLIGPKNYKNVLQKTFYEKAQAIQKASDEAEARIVPQHRPGIMSNATPEGVK